MIFVDTSAFVAIHDSKDPHYESSQKIIKTLIPQKASLITTNYVLAESYTVISQKVGKDKVISFKVGFDPSIRIVRVDEELEEAAWQIFKEIKSKNVSFIDCTSFAIMKSYGVREAFAFDEDFKRAGFRLLG